MRDFFRARFYTINRWLSKLPGFAKQKNSLAFLNGAQFLGVLNDNIFKLVMVFLLIETLGNDRASSILSTAGAIYVIPFLLFSSAAGILADRFSKQRLLVAMKAAEILIMTLALFAFGWRSQWGCYTLLFLLSTHSAMFGPSKYGIIPELVPKEQISRANGLITAFTYLAMILGTFLASFLTDITGHHFVLTISFCLFVAVGGFISAFGIKRTPPQGSEKKFNLLFVSEIYQTLRFCRTIKHLLSAIFGAAFFLFLGAFTQLNIIPYGMQSLGLSEVSGGYLFLSTALGIAFGSFLGGKASRKRIELGLSCFAGVVMSLLFFLLAFFPHNLFFVIVNLVLLGVCGGVFIVPFESFTQVASPDEKRGQVIASANFLSFSGVLMASGALFFFSEILGVHSSTGFGIMGVITLIASTFFTVRLADLSLPYFSRKVLKILYGVKTSGEELLEKSPEALLILPDATKPDTLLLLSVLPDARLFVIQKKPSLWSRLLSNVTAVPPGERLEAIASRLNQHERGCLLLKNGEFPESERPSPLKDLFRSSSILYVRIQRSLFRTRIIFSKHLTP